MDNPLLQPIHGISLQDYAAVVYFQNTGISLDILLGILGISPIIWNEVDMLWTKRMEEDAGLTVVTSYSRYYNEAEHDKRFNDKT